GVRAAMRVPVHARATDDGFELILSSDSGPLVVRVDSDLAIIERRSLTSAAPPWVWAATGGGHVAWADRRAGDEDRILLQLAGAEPVVVAREENATLSYFGTPLVETSDGRPLLAVSTLEEARLVRVVDAIEVTSLGTAFPRHPVLGLSERGVVVVAAGGPAGSGGLPTALAMARLATEDAAPGAWEVLEELPTSCQIEKYFVSSAPTSDAVAWIESCGFRRSAMRICAR
nr:hypothetical protein [Myxococcota bacterium]